MRMAVGIPGGLWTITLGAMLCLGACMASQHDESQQARQALQQQFVERALNRSSYFENGENVKLFDGNEFPMFLKSESIADGHVKSNLTAVRTHCFDYVYDIVNGNVASMSLIDVLGSRGAVEETSAEEKVANLIGNSARVVFLECGCLTFHKDNSHITFVTLDRAQA